MFNFGKEISRIVGPIISQNKAQSSAIGEMMKNVAKVLDRQDGTPSRTIMSDLTKALKLVEAQTQVLTGIDVPEAGKDDRDTAAALKEVTDGLRKIVEENRKQAAEIDDLGKQVDDAAGEADGRDQAKKVKTATDLLDKARRLVDEQTRLLDEVRKTLAA